MIHTRAERLRTARPALMRRAALHLVPTAQPNDQRSIVANPEAHLDCLDSAAALGRDPFKSKVRLWMDKTGRQGLLQPLNPQQRQDDSLSYWSRLLEPIVAAHYTHRTGHRVRRTDTMMKHPLHPWMVATVTREVVASPEVQLLECLCVGMGTAPLWQTGIPEYMRLRTLHLLAVTGLRAVDVAVLLAGQELQIHRVERDEAAISRLIEDEQSFWRDVERDQVPRAGDEGEPMSGKP